ncbi:hypothetical protein A3D01_02505 [Candidatus Woesebacteria bacterium RIFCSPHIGHO2_02_FULL_39_13]|uniref:dTDP-4-dehydrorhamnose 3,5-epimerase n=1 Tax=Candidatus Woesebacteria bacterium RIFCSPHIGHO2_02_FULL_39_13 TaxID=1802505 RepID=A0A1F7Z2P9_9BACT|nr:MAG: hypothetical protein A3D01_02505 [Candidatus Woesebacteria bacterium RIFCSPHIGHO2_02_FULL_39_13]
MDFSYKNLTVEDLKKINFKLNSLRESPTIRDVYYKRLTTYVDGRGDLTELWSEPWNKKEDVARKIEHVYFNTTHEGVIKGWHVHERTFSQYTCVRGKMQVVLVDVRRKFPTFGYVDQFIIGTQNPSLIVIPPGVLKAWKSLRGDSIIVNLLTLADVKDNFKYPWDAILKEVWEPKNG